LQEWGQIEGHLKIGSRPADCREIVAWQRDDRPYDPTDAHVLFLMETTTASNGWFAIYNVPPGKIGVGRSMMFEFPGGRGGGTTQKRFLEVQPGQTVHVALGGQGRPVIGRLLLTAEMKQKSNWQFGLCMAEHQIQTLLPMPEDVKNKPLGDRQAWYSHFMQTEEGKKYAVQQYRDELAAETYPLIVGADGSFRIEDVPAGTYTLHAEAWANAADAIRHRGDKLIEEDVRFTVPDIPGGRSDAPMNIGEVALSESVIASHTGEAAPAFTAKTVDGDDLRLSDFRGKYVLLDFWATWCGSCKNATADLKNIYDEFGKDGRLVVIGLSSDDLPYDPRKYAQDNGLSWRQCWIGADSSIAKMYGVDGIPSFWLIGPDGKVVMASGSVERVHAAVKAGMARF
jgi:peroxiredoxin